MWAQFLGYGFTKPIDDLGPHNPASHPALLDYLGEQFAKETGFDNRDLIRWIVLSEPYSPCPAGRRRRMNERDDPLLGERPMFTSLLPAADVRRAACTSRSWWRRRPIRAGARYEEQEAEEDRSGSASSCEAFGTDEGGETTSFNGTIPQVLMMFNGDLIKNATSIKNGGSFLSVIASAAATQRRPRRSSTSTSPGWPANRPATRLKHGQPPLGGAEGGHLRGAPGYLVGDPQQQRVHPLSLSR